MDFKIAVLAGDGIGPENLCTRCRGDECRL